VTKVAGLLLAAGPSTRMGKPKQLLPISGGTLLGHVLDETLKSNLDKVILILGHHADNIKEVMRQNLQHPKLKVVENREYNKGISSSIIVGVLEVKKSHDHVMILLGDMPNINSSLINLLIYKYLESNLPIGAIKIKAKRSHPVIFSSKMYHELLELRGDVGARDLFIKYNDRVCLVEPDNFYDDSDIDTPEDYMKLGK